MFSFFVLVLWVFLQSAAVYKWFSVDPKLVAFVGMVFVVVVVVETLWVSVGKVPGWYPFRKRVE